MSSSVHILARKEEGRLWQKCDFQKEVYELFSIQIAGGDGFYFQN